MIATLGLFSRLVLILCLCVYGSSTMAIAGGDGVGFSIEICADGVLQTVTVDAKGAPVDTDDACCDCLTCALSPVIEGQAAPDASHSAMPGTVPLHPALCLGTFVQNPNTRPLPRGPPARSDSYPILPDLILMDRGDMVSGMCGNGQPDFKDAVA